MPLLALVDDHVVLRQGLAGLVRDIGYDIAFEAENGEACIKKLATSREPDVILMDINMPVKDGFETTLWLKQNKPHIKVLALSMVDDESSIIRMIKYGARGYVLKECDPSELKSAIDDVIKDGFHYSDIVSGRLVNSVNKMENEDPEMKRFMRLTEKEIQFLRLAASELTYKEVASEMKLSPRTVDGYRDILFEKLKVKTRVGLAMYAIRHGIVHA
ncbi:response regulator transcription factor [Pollutibacter soli]|uniref:response regulator transcription factor n=1 Tax=Pollutibacter soli TaxID=3034157 RepID=UPI003013AB01